MIGYWLVVTIFTLSGAGVGAVFCTILRPAPAIGWIIIAACAAIGTTTAAVSL